MNCWLDLTPIPGTSNGGPRYALQPGMTHRQCLLRVLDPIAWRSAPELDDITGIGIDSLCSELSKMVKLELAERHTVTIPNHERTRGSGSRRNVYRLGRTAK